MTKGYFSFAFQLSDSSKTEILVAYLTELRFEGFEETQTGLSAFIPKENFSEKEFDQVINPLKQLFTFSFTQQEVEDKNWNEEWERSFQPIIIKALDGDYGSSVAVRASFHQPIKNVKNEIIIDPKMSFGTGHHATTAMMMRLMLKENFAEKTVLDFGCGTGILSVLASQLGATTVLGIDNEEWAVANAMENLQLNGIINVTIRFSDHFPEQEQFDVVLANINLAFLQSNFAAFKMLLRDNGVLLVSGFLKSNEAAILEAAAAAQFVVKEKMEEENWLAMVLSK